MPQLSYTTSSTLSPTYSLPDLAINFSINERPEDDISALEFNQAFLYLSNDLYKDYLKLFSDGSKSSHGVQNLRHVTSSSF